MAQFIPGARRDIVCRRDGTVRTAEPQIGYAVDMQINYIATFIKLVLIKLIVMVF